MDSDRISNISSVMSPFCLNVSNACVACADVTPISPSLSISFCVALDFSSAVIPSFSRDSFRFQISVAEPDMISPRRCNVWMKLSIVFPNVPPTPLPPCMVSTILAISEVAAAAATPTPAISPAVPTSGLIADAREVKLPAAPFTALPKRVVRLPDNSPIASDPISFFPIAFSSNFTRSLIPVISAIFTAINALPRKAAILPAVPLASMPSNRPPSDLTTAFITCFRCPSQSTCVSISPTPFPKASQSVFSAISTRNPHRLSRKASNLRPFAFQSNSDTKVLIPPAMLFTNHDQSKRSVKLYNDVNAPFNPVANVSPISERENLDTAPFRPSATACPISLYGRLWTIPLKIFQAIINRFPMSCPRLFQLTSRTKPTIPVANFLPRFFQSIPVIKRFSVFTIVLIPAPTVRPIKSQSM